MLDEPCNKTNYDEDVDARNELPANARVHRRKATKCRVKHPRAQAKKQLDLKLRKFKRFRYRIKEFLFRDELLQKHIGHRQSKRVKIENMQLDAPQKEKRLP